MYTVVGISFKDKGRIYYFSPEKYVLKKNVTVIVETERGLQFGKVEVENFELPENKLQLPLKKVIRISSKSDYNEHKRNLKEADDALKKCKELIQKYKLNMKVLDSNYTFDRSQLVFHFLADNRIDFRELAKELASIYHTRIELRQVGVRDKAKEVGGMGICGCQLCCSKFLTDLDTVSISMAKDQNLSLNPTKINGVCGRLLCCLKYEDECYQECRKNLPEVGKTVKTEKGEGRVINVDILNRTYKVDVPNVGVIEVKK